MAKAFDTFVGYVKSDLRSDAVAGLTVAVMGVPQAMAYALIAGLPPVYGLYTAIVTCAVAAVLGSSHHLVTGPTNALCMVMLSLIAHISAIHPGVSVLEIVFLLGIMAGVVQFGFGLLRLGGVVRYVSNSVVIGFTAGAGILIAANQLRNIMGVDISESGAERFHEVVHATFSAVDTTNLHALVLGAITAVLVLVLPRLHRRMPGALIAVAAAGTLSYLLGWHEAVMGAGRVEIVRDIEPIRGSLAIFHLPELVLAPNWSLTRDLGTGALAVALLGLIEATSISRAIASSSGQRLNFNREFIGQGASKIVGGFFSCFPGSGSFTRSAVCFTSGGRTRMAAAFSAGWTAATLLAFAPFANYIPKASLAGLLIVIAYSMVDKRRLKQAWRAGKNTRVVLVGTLASTLIFPIEYAIFVGVFLSVVILLRVTGKTDLTQLVLRHDGGFDEVPFNRAPPTPVVTVNMEGDLYFAAAEDLDYRMLRCLTPQTRVVVLRMKRLRAVGSSAMAMLDHFWELLQKRNVYLVVSGIEDDLKVMMTGSGLRRQIGEQNIFYADVKVFQSTELALARAQSIVAAEKRAAETGGHTASSGRYRTLTARDMMTRRCIRFGHRHQLREAVWLMSEMQKQAPTVGSQPLFLQDREAKIAGKLSPWRILRALGEDLGADEADTLDDAAVGERFRDGFTRSISDIARTDLEPLGRHTSLTRLLEVVVQKDLEVVPICDDERRIMGMVSTDDLLLGLGRALRMTNGESGDA